MAECYNFSSTILVTISKNLAPNMGCFYTAKERRKIVESLHVTRSKTTKLIRFRFCPNLVPIMELDITGNNWLHDA